jgi:hypothetical protein
MSFSKISDAAWFIAMAVVLANNPQPDRRIGTL